MKDNTQEMLRRARELMGSGQVFQPMGMEAAKEKLEKHLNGGISNARDRLRESAQCEQTVLALNDLLNETQKKAMLLVADNDRLRAQITELRYHPAVVPEVWTAQRVIDVLNGERVGTAVRQWGGMTKREAFAMHIMAALATHNRGDFDSATEAAQVAIEGADALLAELAKGEK